MKALVLFALSTLASAAMATGPTPATAISVTGTSVQIALLTSTGVSNKADGANALAQQNLASNAGNVKVAGLSLQAVGAGGSYISNKAGYDAVAQQNLSSNVGDVTISGNSLQGTFLSYSTVSNSADGKDAMAVQNIASNNSCFTCSAEGGNSSHGGHR